MTFGTFKEDDMIFLLLGTLLLTIHLLVLSKPNLDLNDKENFLLEGEVIEINKNDENYQRVIIKSKEGYRFSLSLYDQEKVELYDQIIGKIKIRDSSTLKNFNLFNREDYNFINNIDIEGYLELENVNETNSILKKIKKGFIDYTFDTVEKYLDNENSGIILKLVLAKSDNLEDSINEKYRDGGLSHLLAISGLHIFIIIFILDFILLKLNMSFNFRTLLIVLVLFLYGNFIDFPSSMSRALLMFSIKRILEINKIPISNLSAIFISAIIILTLNPRRLYDLGFQLSYLSVLGINLLYGKIIPKGKNYITNGIGLYLSVNLFIFPLLVYKFNNFNIFSLFTNLIVTPLFTLVLILSYLGLLFGKFYIIGKSIFTIIGFILSFITEFLSIFLNYLNIELMITNPNLLFIFTYYLFLYLIIEKPKFKYNLKTIYSITTVLISITIVFLIPKLEDNLYLGFYDVGQGDSIYLNYKNKYIQIDTGGSSSPYFNPGEQITAKAIKQRGIDKIDYLILTHFDYDHIGGVEKLLEMNLVDSLIINRPEVENPLYEKIVSDQNIKLFYPTGKEPLILDNNLIIYLFNNGNKFNDKNDSSIVLLIEFKDKRILLTGDISSNIENELGKKIGKVDVLKVSHHGSKESTTMEFLNQVRPDYSIISVGKNNYGHPHPEVLKNLKTVNSKIIRTDESGEILFKIGDTIDYITYEDNTYFYNYIYEFIFSGIMLMMLAFYIKEESQYNEICRF